MQLLMIQIQVLLTIATSLHFAGCITISNSVIYGCKDGYMIGAKCANRTGTENPCDRNTSNVLCYCLMMQPLNGGINDTDADKVHFTCDYGYKLFGENEQTCLNSGHWSNSVPLCIPKDCELSVPYNAYVDDIQNETVYFECIKGYYLPGPTYQTCLHTGKWTNTVSDCVKEDGVACPQIIDREGNVWNKSSPGELSIACPIGFTGNITRQCQNGGKWKLPKYGCIRHEVIHISTQAGKLETNSTEEEIQEVIQNITIVTAKHTKEFFGAELLELSSALNDIATVLETVPERLNDNITNNFLESSSNLIKSSTHEGWKHILESDSGAISVIAAVDLFGKSFTQSLRTMKEQKKNFIKTNIAFEAKKIIHEDVLFPNHTTRKQMNESFSEWLGDINSYILMKAAAFPVASVEYIATTVIYQNVSGILPNLNERPTKGSFKSSSTVRLNGPVLSLTISPQLTEVLDPPITISFQHTNKQLVKPSCTFWQFLGGYSDYRGYWSNRGCKVKSTDRYRTVCECNHLTNFAILMSPFKQADVSSLELTFITYISMGISLVCLLATLGIYLILWQYLKSSRTKLLMNLCVALILAYVIFLAGIERTESSIVCTVIAACLHYIFLVVFCLMLTQGIEMAVSVIYVFKPKYRMEWLLIGSWLCPAAILGISLGITRTKGFGNEQVCCLSTDKGLIWAFVGPSLVVILFNVSCIVLVLRAILRLRDVQNTAALKKLKRSLRSLCIMLPVTGVSWILGIFYIHEDLSFIQYVFSVLNGLQGCTLFMFHCLLNPEVKKAYLRMKEKKYSA
ncbi:adhesion G protein-coupled receptor L2-like isoform X2 [Mercenaria mercenaria]|uniref:adhesion G protein-coupled receptor L2-like isoform X2 n=1 Tax=Mercenaria mercenaria TaxID=6596 RepID=UPI00234EE421|nr:adhesion G protein-coupled receptor L2-like isoform X2 [Mercenaria mercenaria]